MKKFIKKQKQNQQYFENIEYESLKTLIPKAYMQLDDVSLVCKYSPNYQNILLVSEDTGSINYIKTDQIQENAKNFTASQIKPYNKYYINQGQILDVDWHDNSTRIIAGSGDKSCQMVDVQTGKLILEDRVHDNSLRCIKSCQYNPNYFVSGGRDSKLILWDVRLQNRRYNHYNTLIDMGEPEINSVTGASFHQDQNTLITVQAGDNNIKMWDLRKIINNQPKWHEKGGQKIKKHQNPGLFKEFDDQTANKNKMDNFSEEMELVQQQIQNNKITKQQCLGQTYKTNLSTRYQNIITKMGPPKKLETKIKGYTSLTQSKSQQKLFVNSIDNTIHMYKTEQLDIAPPKKFSGHKNNYYSKISISPCEKYIISGSTDFALFIWSIDDKKNIQQQLQRQQSHQSETELSNVQPFAIFDTVHQGEINSVDWSDQNSNFIASVGDDKILYIWDYQSTFNN